MRFLNSDYNVPCVVIDEAITVNTSTVIGNKADFEKLLRLAKVGGCIIAKAVVGGVTLIGALLASPFQGDDGIEVHTITKAVDEFTPYLVFGQITLDDTDCKILITLTSLGA